MRVCLLVLPIVLAGCAFDDGIAVHFGGSSPVSVVESFSAQVSGRHAHGVTTRAGQVVRIDCPVTVVYDINEATGSAVLAQTLTVRLRSARLHRHVRWDVDCSDPLVLELPAAASNVEAAATSATGVRTALPLEGAPSMRAERGTQLVSIGWPEALLFGDYTLEVDFDLPDARAFHEKAVYAASVSCGRSSYIEPLLPGTRDLRHVVAFGVDPAAGPTTIFLPHIAGANALRATVTRKLRC